MNPPRTSLATLLLAGAVAASLPATAQPTSASAATAPLQSVPELNLARYAGLWYQVALFPNRFQKQCTSNTTATYQALADGSIQVLNRCDDANGQVAQALGSARADGVVADGVLAPAQLEVTFLPSWLRWIGWVWARYWVIQLAPDYRYAVVSEPGRDYLWVLSRRPQLSADDTAAIRGRLIEQGFDLSRLQAHPQPQAQPAADAASGAAASAASPSVNSRP